MMVIAWLRKVLPILAIVGLVLGPVTAPMGGTAMGAAATISAMSEDMPCCHPDKPVIPDCQKTCPLMAVCMAKCFPGAPMLGAATFVLQTGQDAIQPGNDAVNDALALEPPARPPRT